MTTVNLLYAAPACAITCGVSVSMATGESPTSSDDSLKQQKSTTYKVQTASKQDHSGVY